MPAEPLTDAALTAIEAYWQDALAHEMRHGSVSGVPANLGARNDVVRIAAALREARGLVAALAFHTCIDGDFYVCPECGVSYGQGGLEPEHDPDCAWDRARAAKAAWAGEG